MRVTKILSNMNITYLYRQEMSGYGRLERMVRLSHGLQAYLIRDKSEKDLLASCQRFTWVSSRMRAPAMQDGCRRKK